MINKKASSIILMIFEVIVVIFVVGLTFSIANTYATSEGINKVIYAKEIALMINALVGVPGDAQVEFPRTATAYTFRLEESQVVVNTAAESANQHAEVKRIIRLPQSHTVGGQVSGQARICLQKNRDVDSVHISLYPCREE